MTITEVPHRAATDTPVSDPPTTASLSPGAASSAPDHLSNAPDSVSETPKRNSIKTADTSGGAALTRSQKWTAGLIVVAALVLAGIGLYLSFEHVADFAYERLHFASLGKAQLFTGGVDTGIMVLIALDLLMAWLRRPISWIRYPVWLLTGATVVLNAASAAPRGRAWQLLDYVAAFAHAVVPILFIAVVEIGRTSIDRIVRPDDQEERDSIPWDRWILSFPSTWRIFRRMRLWGITSYPEMIRRDQELLAYKLWLTRKHDGDLSQVSEDEKLPMTMAPYGYTVDEALAMPDEQDQAAEARQEEAERRRLEADTRRTIAQLKAQEENIRAEGKVEAARAQVEGETGEARAHARAQVSAAERAAELEEKALESAVIAEARAREAAAERQEAQEREERAAADVRAAELEHEAAQKRNAAAEADRAAADETKAFETEKAAEARRRAAEADKAAAEAKKAAAEAAMDAAEANRKAAEEKARTEAALADIERSKKAAAEANRAAAETRRAAAELERRAVENEDAAKRSPRERAVRKVARMILAAGGDADQVRLADIQRELEVSSTDTASKYRQEAADLLVQGYDPQR
ncbi:DUF2637 domain-containing protein [Streptomyces armeniacus]|uniref:DUF2637 domain-containing protein n=1 Tax=Streptomyces armeniacus TaxID=83291 RepID=A0A345XSS0_9ACTN|nr:DUF2637 domain-containing protein [Streptomyces armeniacus]AXK34686.1 DUF2637 domain-containing protein [Streptomyces armeniacus]